MLRQNRIRLVAGILGAAILSSAAFGAETAAKQRTFKTSKEAAEALVAAAAQYDVPSLVAILGPAGKDLVQSDDAVMDKNLAAEFAKQAKEKLAVVPDKANPKRATVIVGGEDWPLPVPLVENAGAWRFDTAAGKREILVRRIGRNELDAIQVCNGYVEAQQEYASEPRGGSGVTQYAQRVVGSAEHQDGRAMSRPCRARRGRPGATRTGHGAVRSARRSPAQSPRATRTSTSRTTATTSRSSRGRDRTLLSASSTMSSAA